MAKIILILLAFVVIAIFAFSYILGALRRLIFGKITKQSRQTRKPADEILYEKDGVTALRGEWKPKQNER